MSKARPPCKGTIYDPWSGSTDGGTHKANNKSTSHRNEKETPSLVRQIAGQADSAAADQGHAYFIQTLETVMETTQWRESKAERTLSVHSNTIALCSGGPRQAKYTVRPGETVPKMDSRTKVDRQLGEHGQQQNLEAIEPHHEIQHPSESKIGKSTAGRRRAPDAEHHIFHCSMDSALRIWNA